MQPIPNPHPPAFILYPDPIPTQQPQVKKLISSPPAELQSQFPHYSNNETIFPKEEYKSIC